MTEWHRGEYSISTDKQKLHIDMIHAYLTKSYWAKGIPFETVKRSVEHSLNFGLYHEDEQVGFARVVTDYATFMYLVDVFILEAHQGQGLGIWMMDVVINHPDMTGIRTWILKTADAHRLYEKFAFEVPSKPRTFMQRRVPYPYPLLKETVD